MKIVVTIGILGDNDEPSDEALAIAADAGFEGFDIMMQTQMMLSDEYIRKLLSFADKASACGLCIPYTHLPFDYPGADDAEGWARFNEATYRAIDLSKSLGAKCSAIHPRTSMTLDYDKRREYERAYEFLLPFCQYAKKAGHTLAVENMRGAGKRADPAIKRFCMQTDELIQLVDALGVGVCWDTGHAHISGQEQYESIMKLGDRLIMVHINDNHADGDAHLIPFLGKIDWSGVARGLRDVGYKGEFNMETSCKRLPPAARPAFARCMYLSGRAVLDM